MGRELKRVPLDFNQPINETWPGYLNPHWGKARNCEACGGSGSSPFAKHLQDQWYGNAPFKPEDRGSKPWQPEDTPVWNFAARNVANAGHFYGSGDAAIMREAKRLCELFNGQWSHHLNADDVAVLVEAGRLSDFTSIFIPGEGWKKKEPFVMPTPEEVNAWSLTGFGHDAINQWKVCGAECKRLGESELCDVCKGEGSLWASPGDKETAENWERTEPPLGDGYQMWQTVGEGAPISPVFATPMELATWLSQNPWNDCDAKTSAEQWMRFIEGLGWAPSFIGVNGSLLTGVEAVGI